MTETIPPPTAPAVDKDGKWTVPWYKYLQGTASSITTEVTVLTFGADPTGAQDSWQAFVDTVSYLSAQGGGKMIIPFGVYLISATVDLDSNIHVYSDDATIVFTSTTPFDVLFAANGGNSATSYPLSFDATIGDLQVYLTAGGSNFARGGWCFIGDNTKWSSASSTSTDRNAEIVRIAQAQETILSFESWIKSPGYASGSGAFVINLEPLENITISGRMRVYGNNARGGDPLGGSVNTDAGPLGLVFVDFRHVVNVNIEGFHISDFHTTGVRLLNVVDGEVRFFKIEHCIATASDAYGVSIENASQNCRVAHGKIVQCRHALASGASTDTLTGQYGVQRAMCFESVDVTASNGDANPIDVHPACDDVRIINCNVDSAALQGILSRARDTQIIGCSVQGACSKGIAIRNETAYTGSAVISNNAIDDVRADSLTILGSTGNGRIFLPGEFVTQASTCSGFVESFINFGSSNELRVRVNTGSFTTGGTPIIGAVSSAQMSSVHSLTTPTAGVGIEVDGETNSFETLVVTNNAIRGRYSPKAFIGISFLNADCGNVTGNTISLPSSPTGSGVSLSSCDTFVVAGNIVTAPTSAPGEGFTETATTRCIYDNNVVNGPSTYGPGAVLVAQTSWNPGNLADGAGETKNVTLTGAQPSDYVDVSFDQNTAALITASPFTDGVSVRLQNETGSTLDLAEGTLRVRVRKA